MQKSRSASLPLVTPPERSTHIQLNHTNQKSQVTQQASSSQIVKNLQFLEKKKQEQIQNELEIESSSSEGDCDGEEIESEESWEIFWVDKF